MVHGNPTWSFYYRRLILELRQSYRAIVPDHIGCGFSDKPNDTDYAYTLSRRVDDFEALMSSLDLNENVTLVLHDWGGMIGMAWAIRHPEAVARIVLLNTAAFHLPKTKGFPWRLWFARTPVGAFSVRGFNAFSRLATRMAVTRAKMPKEIREAYCAPYDSWNNRIATLRFVQDIPLTPDDPAYDLVSEVQGKLSTFCDTPALICWGLRDFVFDETFLEQWRRYLPNAEVHRFADSGHYILEDAAEEVTGLVKNFLQANPLRRSS
ncbi:MAG: alpha/beta fold hydrolase, partial [Myxococcota bacterium]